MSFFIRVIIRAEPDARPTRAARCWCVQTCLMRLLYVSRHHKNVRIVETKRQKIPAPEHVTLFWAFGLDEMHVFKKNVHFVEAKRLKNWDPIL